MYVQYNIAERLGIGETDEKGIKKQTRHKFNERNLCDNVALGNFMNQSDCSRHSK